MGRWRSGYRRQLVNASCGRLAWSRSLALIVCRFRSFSTLVDVMEPEFPAGCLVQPHWNGNHPEGKASFPRRCRHAVYHRYLEAAARIRTPRCMHASLPQLPDRALHGPLKPLLTHLRFKKEIYSAH
jgi:hypothetical protein